MDELVVHCKHKPFDVYIGRGGPWGNPFSHLARSAAKFRVGTRDEAISEFERWARESEDAQARWIRAHVHELRGLRLGCWCAPARCHGEVLVQMAKGE